MHSLFPLFFSVLAPEPQGRGAKCDLKATTKPKKSRKQLQGKYKKLQKIQTPSKHLFFGQAFAAVKRSGERLFTALARAAELRACDFNKQELANTAHRTLAKPKEKQQKHSNKWQTSKENTEHNEKSLFCRFFLDVLLCFLYLFSCFLSLDI